jgi:cytochrome c-type biogenesis protein CcmH/NrfF
VFDRLRWRSASAIAVVGALLLGVVSLGVLAVGDASAQQTAPPQSRPAALPPEVSEQRAVALKRISMELICGCSCNMILAECSHVSCPFADPERKRILSEVAAGMSDDEIIAGYVRDFGRGVLASPPTDGSWLDLSAWIVPIGLLFGGLVLAALFIRDFVARGRVAANKVRAPLDPEFAARVERELNDGEPPVGGGS